MIKEAIQYIQETAGRASTSRSSRSWSTRRNSP